MRISEFLRASCVGALLFTPAMADEVEQVHEQALKVLREQLGQSGSVSTGGAAVSATPADKGDPELARMRAEREAQIKVEAQQRMAERERLQAQRRSEFEQFVKQRERQRQEQREYDERAAQQTGQIRVSDYNEVHARALEALHQAEARQQKIQTTEVSSTPVTDQSSVQAPVAQVEVSRQSSVQPAAQPAPQLVAAASSSALGSSQVDTAEVHSKALEVLHQTQGTGTTNPATNAPGPSPELQKRLKEMQAELEQEQLQKNARGAATAIPDDYVRDLERRAQETVGGASTTVVTAPAASTRTASPGVSSSGLDPEARQIIQRQNEEIAKRLGTTGASAGTAKSAPSMTSQDEAAAREALRQQQQALQSTTPVRASSSNITAPVSSAAPSVTHTTVTDTPNAEYSRELEQRARQILLERAQNPSAVSQPATPAAAPSPATVSVQQPQVVTPAAPVSPAPAMSAPAPTPIATTPPPAAISAAQANADDVHAKALQTLNQIESGGQTLPKTKMQRLKDLTDLYRADKIGPAEYHQKRAQILAEPQ